MIDILHHTCLTPVLRDCTVMSPFYTQVVGSYALVVLRRQYRCIGTWCMSSYDVVIVLYTVHAVCVLLLPAWRAHCRQIVGTAIIISFFAVCLEFYEPCQVHIVFWQPSTFHKVFQWLLVRINMYVYVLVMWLPSHLTMVHCQCRGVVVVSTCLALF